MKYCSCLYYSWNPRPHTAARFGGSLLGMAWWNCKCPIQNGVIKKKKETDGCGNIRLKQYFISILEFLISCHILAIIVISQSINQPTNQATNQPTKQASNQSINQPTNQATNQSINQSIKQSIKHQRHYQIRTLFLSCRHVRSFTQESPGAAPSFATATSQEEGHLLLGGWDSSRGGEERIFHLPVWPSPLVLLIFHHAKYPKYP